MDQYQFVEERLAFYDEQGLTPEPGGEWQEAHYPDPKGVGDRTVWMTFNDHQQQGLYQSEEHGRCCFYNYDTLRFLTHGPFVPGWFDLWDLYDKWKGENGRSNLSKIPKETLTANGIANLAKIPKETLAASSRENLNKIPRETLVATGKANGKANAPAMNDHVNTLENQKKQGRSSGAKMSKETRTSNGKTTTSQKWQCLVTGFIANPGNLSQYQKARGIDTSLRVKVSHNRPGLRDCNDV